MNSYLVAQVHKNQGRPWRARHNQGIHTLVGFVQFVRANNKEDAAKRVSIRDAFKFGKPDTYMVIPMKYAAFFEVEAPTINIKEGSPE